MLEQAIADAAALREQAIKNAEQSVLDKYSKQVKEAIDQMLEVDEAPNKVDEIINEVEEELMQEEESAQAATETAPPTIDAQPAYDTRPGAEDLYTRLTAMIDNLPEVEDGMVNLDLGDFSPEQDEIAASEGDPGVDLGGLGDLGGDLVGGDDKDVTAATTDDNEADELDLQLQEVLDMLEEEVIEEKVDYDPIQDSLNGMAGSGAGSRSRKEANAVMADVVYGEEDEEESEEESEDATGQLNELHETVKFLTQQNDQMESVLSKMELYLEETLLSNAKLLYQNRTLGDASLNERQKSKIVEAIANAESPKEAKRLHETLRATVGSTPNSKKGPQSLSESVNRRSNLSSMLNSRQNINESKQSADPFMEKMQKLAGIKK
jgi:hypothetical protein